jgi:Skp family chaperone for outer membrane proteins
MKISRLFPVSLSAVMMVSLFCLPAIADESNIKSQTPKKADKSQEKPTQPENSPIGVVNIVKVFDGYKRAEDLTARLKKAANDIGAEHKKKAEKIEQLQKKLKTLKPKTEPHQKLLTELHKAIEDLQGWLKKQKDKIVQEHLQQTLEMYSEICAAVEIIARRRRLKLVLQKNDQKLDPKNLKSLIRAIDSKKVFYADSSLDITPDVVKLLNENYTKRKSPTTNPDDSKKKNNTTSSP